MTLQGTECEFSKMQSYIRRESQPSGSYVAHCCRCASDSPMTAVADERAER